MKKIGILGGIGPEATGLFYLNLIKKLQETGRIKRNTDYPQIIINSIPAPELVDEKIQDLNEYIKGLKELDSFGVDFIVMVCNTIHLFHDRLSKEVRTPIIDLREEAELFLKKKNVKTTTILSTELTLKQGLFSFKGIKELRINEKEMDELKKSILARNVGKNNNIANIIADKYRKKGSKIISACTEISLMLEKDKRVIKTTDILIDAVLHKI